MKSPRFFLAAGFALASLLSSASAETFPIFEDASGSMVSHNISAASGKATTLAISSKSTAYISFAVSSSGIDPATVTAARLVLFLPKASKTGTLSIFNLGSSFTETFAGPGPQPAPEGFPLLAAIDLAQTPLKKDYFVADITTQVKAWLTDPTTEHGIGIFGSSGGTATIASKEGPGSGHPAYIEVDVSPSGGTVSGTTASFTGPVGIGTPTPAVLLEVVGDGDDAILGLTQKGSGGSGVLFDNSAQKYFSGIFGNTNRWSIYDITNGNAERLTVLANGNVGIGTSAPGFKLTVAGGGDTQLALQSTSTNGRTYSFQSSNGGVALGDGSFQIIDRTAGVARLFITKDGNVGIGASTASIPAAKLDVRGDVKLGSTGQFFATAGKENLAIIRGAVGGTLANPSRDAGTGFTVARSAGKPTGVYTITFDTPFSGDAVATVTAIGTSVPMIAIISDYTNATIQVSTFATNGTLTDGQFGFIATGPK